MKKAIVCFALLLMLYSAHAFDLNACVGDDLNMVGCVITRGAFGSDPLFFAIIMIGLLAIVMWQARMPMGATLGVSLVIFFALGSSLGSYYSVLLNLAVLSIGILVGLAILHYVRR